jgi:protein involved in polysaccharide export with SLBB domain
MVFPGRFFLFACLWLAPALSWAQSGLGELSKYKLGPGDVISIAVLGEEDLTKPRIRLTDAGTISYPVLGEIKIRGMTVGDLDKFIT